MSNWISVTDALPEDEKTVLIFHPETPDEPVWLGYREDGVWYSFDAWEVPVSHWMPLPTPPVIATTPQQPTEQATT